ncbi:MAG: hypothetical protein Q9163_005939 [Psora crenata]
MSAEIESQPLLDPDFENAGERQFPALNKPIHRNLPTKKAWRKHLRFYVLIFILQFITNFGFYLSDLPLVKLFERQICKSYYGSKDEIPEVKCKLSAIQDKLAYILELKNALDALPALFLSLWYGALANKYGRKPIIAFNYFGELFSLGWILLIYVVTEADRIIAPLVGAAIMEHLSVPFLTILVLICIRFFLLWFLPETALSLQGFRGSDSIPNDDQALHAPSGILDGPEQSLEPEEDRGRQTADATNSAEPHSRALKSILDLVHRPQLQFCFLAILFKRVAFSSETLLYQYASDVLDTELSHTAWLRALQAVGATFSTGVGIPLSTQFLIRYARQSSLAASFSILQGSLAILVVGFLSLWLGRHTAIVGIATLLCGLGEGLSPSLQAVALSVVTASQYAVLFTSFAVIDTTAKLIGGPFMAFLFSIRDADGHSLGFCFLLSTCLFAILMVTSYFVPRLPSAIL